MSSLALPRPENLRTHLSGRQHLVEADVYDICERIKEIDPNLYVYVYDPPVSFAGKIYNWSVCEMCPDGVERFVSRYEELDARILEDVQYMRHVPFEKRFAEAERREAKMDAEHKEAEFEKLYEEVGRPMLTQLEHDGFIQRSVSYAKRGVRPR